MPTQFYDNNMKGWGPDFVKRRPEVSIEQVSDDAFDAERLEFLPQTGFAETRYTEDALVGRCAAGELRERRPHLSADAQDHEIAGNALQRRW